MKVVGCLQRAQNHEVFNPKVGLIYGKQCKQWHQHKVGFQTRLSIDVGGKETIKVRLHKCKCHLMLPSEERIFFQVPLDISLQHGLQKIIYS